MRRVGLPPGGSTLMTSAPRPARVNPQYSACSSASSMTRMPVRGPRPGWVFIVARIYPVRRGGNMPTDSAARVHLSVAEARTLSERAMRGIGYDAEEARILADHVVDAAAAAHAAAAPARRRPVPRGARGPARPAARGRADRAAPRPAGGGGAAAARGPRAAVGRRARRRWRGRRPPPPASTTTPPP